LSANLLEKRNRIIIPQSTGWLSADSKFSCSFWLYIKDNTNTPYGLTTQYRTILGTRPADPTDDDSATIGWSYAIQRVSGSPDKVRAMLNVNGQRVESPTNNLMDFRVWYFITITVDCAQDYFAISHTIPADATYVGVGLGDIYDVSDNNLATVGDYTAADSGGTTAFGVMTSDTNDIAFGYDAYTEMIGATSERFYLACKVSNLKFYSSSVVDTTDAEIENQFTKLVSQAWRVVRPADVSSLELAPDDLIASYSLENLETLEAGADSNLRKRSFIGTITLDGSDLPDGFETIEGFEAKSMVFNNTTTLTQAFYVPETPLDAEDQITSIFNEDFTIEFWFKYTEAPSVGDSWYMLSKTLAGTTEFGLDQGFFVSLYNDAGDVKARFRYLHGSSGDGMEVDSSEVLTIDTWYHIAIIASNKDNDIFFGLGTPGLSKEFMVLADEDGALNEYEDFDETDPDTSTGLGASETGNEFHRRALTVGGWASSATVWDLVTPRFKGKISELRMWKRALSLGEIEAYRFKQLTVEL
jgi:hypothetical protein